MASTHREQRLADRDSLTTGKNSSVTLPSVAAVPPMRTMPPLRLGFPEEGRLVADLEGLAHRQGTRPGGGARARRQSGATGQGAAHPRRHNGQPADHVRYQQSFNHGAMQPARGWRPGLCYPHAVEQARHRNAETDHAVVKPVHSARSPAGSSIADLCRQDQEQVAHHQRIADLLGRATELAAAINLMAPAPEVDHHGKGINAENSTDGRGDNNGAIRREQ